MSLTGQPFQMICDNTKNFNEFFLLLGDYPLDFLDLTISYSYKKTMAP